MKFWIFNGFSSVITGAISSITSSQTLTARAIVNNVILNTGEYTILDYIESTGTQWIDTGVVLNMNTDGYEVIAQATVASQNGMILGDYTVGNNYYWLYHYNDGGDVRMYLTNSGGGQTNFETGIA